MSKKPRETVISKFIERVPNAQTWQKRQEEVFGTQGEYEEGIRRVIDVQTDGMRWRSEDGLFTVAKALAEERAQYHWNYDANRCLSHFRTLLFICYCELLRKRHAGHDDFIEGILERRTLSKEMDRRRMRRHVSKIPKMIQQLIGNGWSMHRVTEMFLFARLSPSDFVNIQITDLVERLTLAEPLASTDAPHFTIPGLLAQMLYSVGEVERYPFFDICDDLGYRFEKSLDPSHCTLLSIMSYLHQPMPVAIFERSRGLSEAGSSSTKPSSVARLNDAASRVLEQQTEFETTIRKLIELGILRPSDISSVTFVASSRQQWLSRVDESARWKVEAARAILCAFPTHLEDYTIATLLLPQLDHALPALLDDDEIVGYLQLELIVEVYVVATKYGDKDSKLRRQSIAEHFSSRLDKSSHLHQSVRIRREALNALTECKWHRTTPPLLSPTSITSPTDGGHERQAEFLLYKAQRLLDEEQYSAALTTLDCHQPALPTEHLSTMMQSSAYDINVLKGKALRFAGRFEDSKHQLADTLDHHDSTSGVSSSTLPKHWKASAHLAAAYCEAGDTSFGAHLALQILNAARRQRPSGSGIVRRLTITLSYAYLMDSMRILLIAGPAATTTVPSSPIRRNQYTGASFEAARSQLDSLNRFFATLAPKSATRSTKTNHFTTLLALAIVSHLEADYLTAIHRYDAAFDAARACGWAVGYSESIIWWSKSLCLRFLGDSRAADETLSRARAIKSDASFCVLGLGTAWPAVLKKQSAALGCGVLKEVPDWPLAAAAAAAAAASAATESGSSSLPSPLPSVSGASSALTGPQGRALL